MGIYQYLKLHHSLSLVWQLFCFWFFWDIINAHAIFGCYSLSLDNLYANGWCGCWYFVVWPFQCYHCCYLHAVNTIYYCQYIVITALSINPWKFLFQVSAYSSFLHSDGVEEQRRKMNSQTSEPAFTYFSDKFFGTLDYIFYTGILDVICYLTSFLVSTKIPAY